MGQGVTYRKTANKTDKAGAICVGVILALVVIFVVVLWNVFTPEGNVIENSSLWGGYSQVGVHQIYDAKTGVMYAVTDAGDICVMVDADGNPRVVD